MMLNRSFSATIPGIAPAAVSTAATISSTSATAFTGKVGYSGITIFIVRSVNHGLFVVRDICIRGFGRCLNYTNLYLLDFISDGFGSFLISSVLSIVCRQIFTNRRIEFLFCNLILH